MGNLHVRLDLTPSSMVGLSVFGSEVACRESGITVTMPDSVDECASCIRPPILCARRHEGGPRNAGHALPLDARQEWSRLQYRDNGVCLFTNDAVCQGVVGLAFRPTFVGESWFVEYATDSYLNSYLGPLRTHRRQETVQTLFTVIHVLGEVLLRAFPIQACPVPAFRGLPIAFAYEATTGSSTFGRVSNQAPQLHGDLVRVVRDRKEYGISRRRKHQGGGACPTFQQSRYVLQHGVLVEKSAKPHI